MDALEKRLMEHEANDREQFAVIKGHLEVIGQHIGNLKDNHFAHIQASTESLDERMKGMAVEVSGIRSQLEDWKGKSSIQNTENKTDLVWVKLLVSGVIMAVIGWIVAKL